MIGAYRFFIFIAVAAFALAPRPEARAGEGAFSAIASETPQIIASHDFPNTPVRPGGVIRGVIVVIIPQGWHVYAPGVDKYRKLEIRNGEGPVDDPRFEYPPGHAMELVGEQVSVYDGRVEIGVEAIVSSGAKKGVNFWRPVVSWQSCSDRLCLAPETQTLNIAINVNNKG